MPFERFLASVDTIVHGTTVTTNATLTNTGAHSAMLTTRGVRDALEMRRGIRERQYDNRYTNVTPLVPRYLRVGVGGRIDRDGKEIEPLSLDDIRAAVALFKAEKVETVSICFMNSFASPAQERAAAELVRNELPDAYLTVSSALLPTIRFYERVSTTALNSYVGPKLNRYLDRLVVSLRECGFGGLLLIMQSNGGVMSPQIAREKAALTLLSGPAGGPAAGLYYARAHGVDKCITTDMGGTSFEASVSFGTPAVINDGEIARHKIALPMLDIHTIGAGGGSIGWLDEGGMLRMGPQSAGAAPGPACYGQGGTLPTVTDANLVLGYLDPVYFAGGKITLDVEAARRAIETHIARPMGLSVAAAAAGMYRVACNNMAQGVREVTIKRGYDPREFPLIAAGGAGPMHSCLICSELEIPLAGGAALVVGAVRLRHAAVGAEARLRAHLRLALRHARLAPPAGAARRAEGGRRAGADRRAYSAGAAALRDPLRLPLCQAVSRGLLHGGAGRDRRTQSRQPSRATSMPSTAGSTAIRWRPRRRRSSSSMCACRRSATTEDHGQADNPHHGDSPAQALKGRRSVYVPETGRFEEVPVYDGHALRHGNRIAGPALIETITTVVLVSGHFDCVVDRYGSFALYRKGREDLVRPYLRHTEAELVA